MAGGITGDGDIGGLLVNVDFSDLFAGNTVFAGQGAENVTRPNLLFFAAINL